MTHAPTAPGADGAPGAEGTVDLFDRRIRAARRARMAQRAAAGGGYLAEVMRAMLLERLDDVTRSFADILLIGAHDHALARALAQRGRLTIAEQSAALAVHASAALQADGIAARIVVGEEDRLPVDPAAFDLIIWPGGLESVNDVQGALLRCRLALREDGLLLGCFIGNGSLPMLRHCLSDPMAQRIVQRLHPQIEVRAIGDLLTRAGLALSVADCERSVLRYTALDRLVGDLRDAAATNMLAGTPPLTRAQWAGALARFDALRDEAGRASEQISFVHFSGWAPDASQPAPARRGSGTVSLAAALAQRGRSDASAR